MRWEQQPSGNHELAQIQIKAFHLQLDSL